MTWAVAGWCDYSERGDLGEPDAVNVATTAYRLDSDPVARFIDDECIVTPHGHTPAGDLYARWQRWAVADGVPEMSGKAFGQALDRKGYEPDRVRGTRIRRGLLLAAEGDDQ